MRKTKRELDIILHQCWRNPYVESGGDAVAWASLCSLLSDLIGSGGVWNIYP